ncbi:MAG: hypothetical protein D6679_07995 [Candidatus Hydrogenedentota bacterium]|nr:MAG: hypothetical protein D6679_07995 [Candidatus Hydrogenedentota bacterium]
MALILSAVFGVFFSTAKSGNEVERHATALRLASSEMERLASYSNPLYIGISGGKGTGEKPKVVGRDISFKDHFSIVRRIHAAETNQDVPGFIPSADDLITAFIEPKDYVRRLAVVETEEEKAEAASGSTGELRHVSRDAVFARTVEREILSFHPPLVKVWVTVYWNDRSAGIDPLEDGEADSVQISTLLAG